MAVSSPPAIFLMWKNSEPSKDYLLNNWIHLVKIEGKLNVLFSETSYVGAETQDWSDLETCLPVTQDSCLVGGVWCKCMLCFAWGLTCHPPLSLFLRWNSVSVGHGASTARWLNFTQAEWGSGLPVCNSWCSEGEQLCRCILGCFLLLSGEQRWWRWVKRREAFSVVLGGEGKRPKLKSENIELLL